MTKKNKQRVKHSDKELFEVSEHLGYEYVMLKNCLDTLRANSLNEFLNYAVLEAFLLHARNIIFFFYKSEASGQPDDAVAENFFSNPKHWQQVRGKKPSLIENVQTRMGKNLAHLTYKRLGLTDKERKWPCDDIYSHLITLLKLFVNKVNLVKKLDDRLLQLSRPINASVSQ